MLQSSEISCPGLYLPLQSMTLTSQLDISYSPWMQDINWMFIKPSWISYVGSIHVLRAEGMILILCFNLQQKSLTEPCTIFALQYHLHTEEVVRSYISDVLKDFAKFKEKHLCRSLFLNKVSACQPGNIFKKRLRHRFFSCKFQKSFKNTYFVEHLRTAASNHIYLIVFQKLSDTQKTHSYLTVSIWHQNAFVQTNSALVKLQVPGSFQ